MNKRGSGINLPKVPEYVNGKAPCYPQISSLGLILSATATWEAQTKVKVW